jgi:hypothetical protein
VVTGSVATVSGLSGTGAGVGTIASTYLIGRISDRYSFGPILVGASLVRSSQRRWFFCWFGERTKQRTVTHSDC